MDVVEVARSRSSRRSVQDGRVSCVVGQTMQDRVQAQRVSVISVERAQLVSAASEHGELVGRQRRQPAATRGVGGIDGEAGGLSERVAPGVADHGSVDRQRTGGGKPGADERLE